MRNSVFLIMEAMVYTLSVCDHNDATDVTALIRAPPTLETLYMGNVWPAFQFQILLYD